MRFLEQLISSAERPLAIWGTSKTKRIEEFLLTPSLRQFSIPTLAAFRF